MRFWTKLMSAAVCTVCLFTHYAIGSESSPAAASQQPGIGVMLGNYGGDVAGRIAIARRLGATWYRPLAVTMGKGAATCPDCDAIRKAGFKVVMVIRNGGDGKTAPSVPVRDVAEFQRELRKLLRRYQPALLVVENEQDNERLFYAGSPQEYVTELKAACAVAHEVNVRCADGGLTSSMLSAVLIDEFWRTNRERAVEFATLIMEGRAARARNRSGGAFHVAPQPAAMRKKIESFLQKRRDDITRGRALLNGAQPAGIDVQNFHWYEPDPRALEITIQELKRLSSKPLACDEVGQRSDDPSETKGKLRVLQAAGISPIVWFSVDTRGGARALTERDGSLRTSGKAFRAITIGDHND